MKNTFIILSVALSMIAFISCKKVIGEGPIVTEARSVSGFKSVAVSISGTVNYKIDPVYKVEIQAQQNIIDVLQTHKVGDELVIKFKDGVRVKDHEQIVVTVSAPFAEMVNLSGSAEFNLINDLSAANLSLRISGSGNISVHKVTLTDKLTSTVSGSGSITISDGAVKNESLKISGSGKMDLSTLLAENTDADISGSGDIHVSVSHHLDASISGSGSVFYRGNPLISTDISGSGKVRPF